MAVVEQNPTDPEILTALTNYAAGASGAAFLAALNARQDEIEENLHTLQARAEEMTAALGNGWISGGNVTAGVGLSVSVAAGKAFVGQVVEWDSAITVGGLTPSTTNYLWLWQNGTATATASSTTPIDSSRGQALLWGTATTNTTDVTAVSNVRATAFASPPAIGDADTIALAHSAGVDLGRQLNLYEKLTVSGTLTVRGKVRVMGA